MKSGAITAKQGAPALPNLIPAPKWLVDRVNALQRMPPPTLLEVETSFRAAEAMRLSYEAISSNRTSARKKQA